jgi:uncharacterized integral membrane protein
MPLSLWHLIRARGIIVFTVETGKRRPQMSGFFKRPKVIAIIGISILALIILLQNMHTVTFSLFFWKVEVSQLLLVLLMLVIGYVLGLLTAHLRGPRE